ncbi:hypothetical protein GIB67_041887 [Kingdonia uniflora]|uniref:BHLH domain-containing protein n=1 Tax=Kingdonia uniflora TaxID=39325 RepID=A0A7J7L617_9MAGN|nr:hypothetical protein GIB67_041887 [Kingdonia uniflora]
MAAFSYQQQQQQLPFLLDSVFLPSIPIMKMSGSIQEGDINTTTSSSSCFPAYSSSLHESFQENPIKCSDNNSPSLTDKHNSANSSSVVEFGEQVTQMKKTTMEKQVKKRDVCSAQSKDPKRSISKKQKKTSPSLKETEENQKGVSEEPPKDYVHVRARRGEATDSHSLAERVRRERISERLKMLQGLVPGCDKVSSKALMLDEIINYVQSLQSQVEFLSMKIASMSPMIYDLGGDIDAYMFKSEKPSELASTLPSMQQCIPAPSTDTISITSNNTSYNYPIQDSFLSSILQQGQRPTGLSQDIGNILWGLDDQRQRFFDQQSFTNLCAFQ